MELLDKLTDSASARNTGGIWYDRFILASAYVDGIPRNLPMTRTWPYAEKHLANIDSEADATPIAWPDPEHQRLLIELYFTYAHPDIPVIHKPSFLALCDQQSPTQKRSK